MARNILLVLLLLGVAACAGAPALETSSTTGSPESPTPSTTGVELGEPTTTSAVPIPEFAIDYPAIPVDIRQLTADELPLYDRGRTPGSEQAAVPEVVFSVDFAPSNLDLDPSRPVKFTNGTDEAIVIVFASDDIDDVPLDAWASQVVDFSAVPEQIYRFYVMRGNSKIPGVIDARPQGTNIFTEPSLETVRQASFSGRLSIEVPRSSLWEFNPQYDGIVGKPRGDEWPQGDFQWSLLSGAPLKTSGLYVELTLSNDPRSVLEQAVVPANCVLIEARDVQRAGLGGEEIEYECDGTVLTQGYLSSAAETVFYSVANSPIDRADLLLEVMETIEIGEPGGFTAVTRGDGPASVAYTLPFKVADEGSYSVRDGAYALDLINGDLGIYIAGELDVLSVTTVAIRNFDDVTYQIGVNGGQVAPLHPSSILVLELLDFDSKTVHITASRSPLAGLGVTFDLTERTPGPPIEMFSSTERIALEPIVERVWPAAEIRHIEFQVPAGWTKDEGASASGRGVYVRGATETDLASVLYSPLAYVDAQAAIDAVSVETRALPTEIDTLIVRGEVWTILHWAPEGHPMVTLGLVEYESTAIRLFKLTSSPEDHERLYESVLVPAMETFLFLFDE